MIITEAVKSHARNFWAALVMIAESLDMTEIDVASTEIERLRREIDELHPKVNSDANQRHRFDNDSIV